MLQVVYVWAPAYTQGTLDKCPGHPWQNVLLLLYVLAQSTSRFTSHTMWLVQVFKYILPNLIALPYQFRHDCKIDISRIITECQERPHHVDSTMSRLLYECKRRRAWLVLRWEMTWKAPVLSPCTSCNPIFKGIIDVLRRCWQTYLLKLLSVCMYVWIDFDIFGYTRFCHA